MMLHVSRCFRNMNIFIYFFKIVNVVNFVSNWKIISSTLAVPMLDAREGPCEGPRMEFRVSIVLERREYFYLWARWHANSRWKRRIIIGFRDSQCENSLGTTAPRDQSVMETGVTNDVKVGLRNTFVLKKVTTLCPWEMKLTCHGTDNLRGLWTSTGQG